MLRTIVLCFSISLFSVCALYAQSDATSIQLIGIMAGTNAVQGIAWPLQDRAGQTVATSDQITPFQGMAFYQHGFGSNVSVRFASGYVWARQQDESFQDFTKIDSADATLKTKSTFHTEGFPLELTLLFHNSVNESRRVQWQCGIGFGYYSINYEANGNRLEKQFASSRSHKQSYESAPFTLAGWTQFFVVGFQMQVTQRMHAVCQVSKIGLSGLYIEQDMSENSVYHEESVWQRQYGHSREQYMPKSGFNELSISVGVSWTL